MYQLPGWLLLLLLLPRMTLAQRPDLIQAEAQYKTTPTAKTRIALGNGYKKRAEWFMEMPQYNRDSTVFYYYKAIAILDGATPPLLELLAAVYTDLSDHYYRHFDKISMEKMADKAWIYLQKLPTKNDNIKQLQYKLFRNQAFSELDDGGNSKKGLAFILKALSLYQGDNRIEIQAKLLQDKGNFYGLYNNGIECLLSYKGLLI